MIKNPTQTKFFIPTSLANIDKTAEPTLEGIAGEQYDGTAIVSTGQVINAMDSHSRRPFQADTDGVATRWRVDVSLDRELRTRFWMLDGENLRDIYAHSLKQIVDIYHDTNSSFASATEITPIRTLSGIIGSIQPYVRLNGDADSIRIPHVAALNVTTGDFAIGIGFRAYSLTGTQILCLKTDGARLYGIYLQNDDLWFVVDDGITTISSKIKSDICELNDDVCIHANFDRSGNATGWVSLNGNDKTYLDEVAISTCNLTLANGEDLYIGLNGDTTSQAFSGRVYWWALWNRLATESEIDDEFNQVYPASGVAISLNHDGLSDTVNKWNSNFGAFTQASVTGDIMNTPDVYESNGFYLMEFDQVNKRYYFTDINSAGATAQVSVNALIGQVVQGQIFTFNGLTPGGGYSGSIDYPGIMIRESLSGIVQAEKRFGKKPTWSLQFQVSTRQQMEDLQTMLEALDGALIPFWVCFNYDEPLPVVHRVRIQGGINWNFQFGVTQPWQPSIELVADI